MSNFELGAKFADDVAPRAALRGASQRLIGTMPKLAHERRILLELRRGDRIEKCVKNASALPIWKRKNLIDDRFGSSRHDLKVAREAFMCSSETSR